MTQKFIIGDVVMYGNNIMIIKEPREEGHFDLLWNNWIIYSYINIEEIKPVPLTTEILEKNGWKFIGHQMDFDGFLFDIYSKRDILPYLYCYYATKDFSVSICGELVLPNMKYVHELQHLLFGLGINHEMEV